MTSPVESGRPGRYVYDCALRWSDLDAYGHVNNARFLTLYEEARVALMFAGGRARGVDSFADGVVIYRHEIDYLRPVEYALGVTTAEHAPTVRIEVWVEDLRQSRFTIAYELFDDGVLASRARSVLVPFDLERRRARRLTEQEHEFLRPYLVEPTAPKPMRRQPDGPARPADGRVDGTAGPVDGSAGPAGECADGAARPAGESVR